MTREEMGHEVYEASRELMRDPRMTWTVWEAYREIAITARLALEEEKKITDFSTRLTAGSLMAHVEDLRAQLSTAKLALEEAGVKLKEAIELAKPELSRTAAYDSGLLDGAEEMRERVREACMRDTERYEQYEIGWPDRVYWLDLPMEELNKILDSLPLEPEKGKQS